MLGKGKSSEQGRGNLFFGSILSQKGYWKRTTKDVQEMSNRKFGIKTTEETARQESFEKFRTSDVKETTSSRPQKNGQWIITSEYNSAKGWDSPLNSQPTISTTGWLRDKCSNVTSRQRWK